jgi:hypothetical protein
VATPANRRDERVDLLCLDTATADDHRAVEGRDRKA